MPATELTRIARRLSDFADTIRRIVVAGRSDGTLRQAPAVLRWWSVDKWEYGERGLRTVSGSLQEAERRTWHDAVSSVVRELDKTGAYASAQAAIKTVAKDGQILLFGQFVTALVHVYLANGRDAARRAKATVAAFVDLLRDRPHTCDVTVELTGIAVLSSPIHFTACGDDVQLRAINVKDLELRRLCLGPGPLPPEPTERGDSVMRLGFRTSDARGGYLFQLKVYKALCILRLFRVSAVDAVSYEMRRIEKPLRLNCGTITSRGTSRQHKYSIAQGDVAHLRRFWKRVSPVLPQVVFEPSAEEADCVSIAYHRYCNAVLQGGLWERRVATAVMGLEALFLEGDGELKYRLGLRVARVLGLLGLDPHKVTKELRDAYDVRSKYVHGSALSKAKKKTIGAGCDGQNVFTLNVFNYLRLSILVWLVISPGNKKPLSKRELLQLIDRSMVDSSQARVLEEHLRPVAEIIGGWQ